jgi:hypothetical protein
LEEESVFYTRLKESEIAENKPLGSSKNGSTYCTFTALRRKSLIINGAGEGNRTLVTIPQSFGHFLRIRHLRRGSAHFH